jgi:hypothetical protein
MYLKRLQTLGEQTPVQTFFQTPRLALSAAAAPLCFQTKHRQLSKMWRAGRKAKDLAADRTILLYAVSEKGQRMSNGIKLPLGPAELGLR